MLGLTDHQLSLVIEGADRLPVDKRDVYLQRIGAQLTLRGGPVTDADVESAVGRALRGLVHHQPAA